MLVRPKFRMEGDEGGIDESVASSWTESTRDNTGPLMFSPHFVVSGDSTLLRCGPEPVLYPPVPLHTRCSNKVFHEDN